MLVNVPNFSSGKADLSIILLYVHEDKWINLIVLIERVIQTHQNQPHTTDHRSVSWRSRSMRRVVL